jgi:hypothetical protein
MIERACEIVEMPNGGLAALMPLANIHDKHWVAVQDLGTVLHANGHVHLKEMSDQIASKPWDEEWKPIGRRDVVVVEPDKDFDLGGGD